MNTSTTHTLRGGTLKPADKRIVLRDANGCFIGYHFTSFVGQPSLDDIADAKAEGGAR